MEIKKGKIKVVLTQKERNYYTKLFLKYRDEKTDVWLFLLFRQYSIRILPNSFSHQDFNPKILDK